MTNWIQTGPAKNAGNAGANAGANVPMPANPGFGGFSSGNNSSRIDGGRILRIPATMPEIVMAKPTIPPELLNEPGYLNREVLGAGDQIQVSVFGQPDLSAEVTVGETGTITLPLIGTVLVRGKSPAEVEKMFAQRLLDGKYLRDPKVAVQIQQQRSRAIYVLGEVQKPGRIALQGQLSILDALSEAGGLTANADAVVPHVNNPQIR